MEKNQILFDLVKNHEWNELIDKLKNNDIINVNIRDTNYNYLIQYIVMYNKKEIVSYLINRGCRLDIMDNDGRSLLYTPIKYNYIEILELLLHFNNNIIGISLIDLRDNTGMTPLFYSIIFNNIDAFDILVKNNSDLLIFDKELNSLVHYAVKYKSINILKKLIKFKINMNILNNEGLTALHIACIYNYTDIAKLLITVSDINISDYKKNFTPLLYCITLNNIKLSTLLIKKDADLNIQDYYGNTALHLAILEQNNELIKLIVDNDIVNYNILNLDGNLPLHLYLQEIKDNSNITDNQSIIHIIEKTNINIQNNDGDTCLYLLIKKNLWKNIIQIIEDKKCNFFIQNRDNESIINIYDENSKDYNNIIDIAINSYYNLLIKKNNWKSNWETLCSKNTEFNFKNLKKEFNFKNTNQKELCKKIIKNYIVKNKISIPFEKNYTKINIEYGIFVDKCSYTGITLDIICGLLLLLKKYNNIGTSLSDNIVDNNKVEKYYETLGIYSSYKVEILNFEILWIYQKLLFPTNFDTIIDKMLNNKNIQYIIIPIGIEVSIGSHANILLWDKTNNHIERFEPNGARQPYKFNYNPKLLDSLLNNKFSLFDDNIKYLSPYDYLPIVGFQQYEAQEYNKCNRIGDPNGFCAIWCIWWVDMRLKYNNIENKKLFEKLYKNITESNYSFKNLIRNYSKNITDIRDTLLKKINIDINDWVNDNYSDDLFDKLIKILYKEIK